MENDKSFETLAAHLEQDATVKNVYGEPIITQGKTIIPVAKIAMGMGTGFGRRPGKNGKQNKDDVKEGENKTDGGGSGGGMVAKPQGVYEVTEKCTRYIPADAGRYVLIGGIIGLFIGGLLAGRSYRKNKEK